MTHPSLIAVDDKLHVLSDMSLCTHVHSLLREARLTLLTVIVVTSVMFENAQVNLYLNRI